VENKVISRGKDSPRPTYIGDMVLMSKKILALGCFFHCVVLCFVFIASLSSLIFQHISYNACSCNGHRKQLFTSISDLTGAAKG